MKTIPFNQLKSLLPVKHFNFLPISRNAAFPTFNNYVATRPSLGENIGNKSYPIASKGRQYSFFSKKNRYSPIKCKLKSNEYGETIAEPYVSKKPSCFKIDPLGSDFTLNPEDNCKKLQGKIISAPLDIESKPNISTRSSKSNFQCPNALTKYLKIKGECHPVFKECEGKDPCARAKEITYTGRDCGLGGLCKKNIKGEGTHKGSRAESRQNKARNIVDNLLSKLKSKKMMKPSGYISEELINEAICNLRSHRLKKKSSSGSFTSLNKTFHTRGLSNCGKTFGKQIGGQNISKQFSTEDKVFENIATSEFAERDAINSCVNLVEHKERRSKQPNSILDFYLESEFCGVDTMKNARFMKSSSDFRKIESLECETAGVDGKRGALTEPDEDFFPTSFKPLKKSKKKPPHKSKSGNGVRRKKRSRFWFSKIPIEPNVKGSVIFANGTAQVLEDPCRILSVNFFNSDENEEVKTKEVRCPSAVNYTLDSYDFVTDNALLENKGRKKVSSKTKLYPKQIEEGVRSYEGSCVKNEQFLPNLRSRKVPKMKLGRNEDNKFKNCSVEPIVRQKKVSRLDKTIKSFTTTEYPDDKNPKNPTKKYSREQKSKSYLDLYNHKLSNLSERVSKNRHSLTMNNLVSEKEQERPKTASSIGSEFVKKVKDANGFKSDTSFVKIKAACENFDSGEEQDIISKKFVINNMRNGINGSKKDLLFMPSITRPVTQKPAHLDILKSRVFTPISSTWKVGAGSPKKLSTTKEKITKKKIVRSANNIVSSETTGLDYQQIRQKSTWKSALSWKSRCEGEDKPCSHKKKDYDANSKTVYPLPVDWDYEDRAPKEMVRKWGSWECPAEKQMECPVTSEDMKKGPPYRKPPSASALNRCNFDECQNRLRCRKPVSKCRRPGYKNKPIGSGQ